MVKDASKKPKIRTSPRISSNQLVKYLEATPAGRQRIVRDQKRPSAFQTAYYKQATELISAFIAGGLVNEEPLVAAVDANHASNSESDYARQVVESNTEALESFLDLYEILDLPTLPARIGSTQQKKLVLGGVPVSVSPHILFYEGGSSIAHLRGGINLHFAKNPKDSLSENAGSSSSCLIQKFIEEQVEEDTKVKRSDCITIDVFGQAVFAAPKAFKTRLKNLEAACTEVKLWWPAL